jgi:hypothetical protein
MIVNKVRAVVGRWAGGERERYATPVCRAALLSFGCRVRVVSVVKLLAHSRARASFAARKC